MEQNIQTGIWLIAMKRRRELLLWRQYEGVFSFLSSIFFFFFFFENLLLVIELKWAIGKYVIISPTAGPLLHHRPSPAGLVFWRTRRRRSELLVCVICKMQHIVQTAGGDGWRGDGETNQGQSVWMNCIQLRDAPHDTADCGAHSFILLQPEETSKTQNTPPSLLLQNGEKNFCCFIFHKIVLS